MSIRTFSTPVLALAGALCFTIARADFTDTFEGGVNVGGWAWNLGADTMPGSGGNPGAYLANDSLDTPFPSMRAYEATSPFIGDYRAMGVTGISVDLRADRTDFPVGGGGFNITLILRSTNGTPFDDWDDDYVYLVGDPIPVVGEGWFHYHFDIDPTGNDLPGNWRGGGADPGVFNPGVTFGDVITNVDQVQISFLDPEWAAVFQNWSVGADNVTIYTAPVPEPATIAALGLGALALLRRKKK